MGEPLLLLEAASRYRGDLEDRLTELFAVALSEHEGFCREVLTHVGVRAVPPKIRIRTQETFSEGPARVDVVIRGSSDSDDPLVVVFFENKYNPRKLTNSYWFDRVQAKNQAQALRSQPEPDKHLVAVASDRDLHRRRPEIPPQYGQSIGWNQIADLAHRAGGPIGWQTDARRPSAAVPQRILLEFWAYLKGDTVGALDEDDISVLGQIPRVENRVTRLLERVADELDWDEGVDVDWSTEGDAPIFYIAAEAPAGSWVSKKDNGARYALVAGAEWSDTGPVGQPQLYAGCGFTVKRDERHSVQKSPWPALVQKAGLFPVFDSDGIYVFARRPLSEIVHPRATLSAQVAHVAEWIQNSVDAALAAPCPRESNENPHDTRRRPRRSAKPA
jgi:hypothetical protein